MTTTSDGVQTDAPISTWMGIGGRADALAAPGSVDELRTLLKTFDESVRVLGAGANLLVDDAGVDGLVVSLEGLKKWTLFEENEDGVVVRVGAGASLPLLIVDMARHGWGGLEGLGGVPASVGGAVRMNAGGAFGVIGDCVEFVRGVNRNGDRFEIHRNEIAFAYRTSGLENRIITEVGLSLTRADAAALRDRLKDVMAKKKKSQPMAEKSAGCIFKNPLIDDVRVSAGKLIDQAGCKGARAGGVEVSSVHGNFFVTSPGASASDVMELMRRVEEAVKRSAGVLLEPEIVIWKRAEQ